MQKIIKIGFFITAKTSREIILLVEIGNIYRLQLYTNGTLINVF